MKLYLSTILILVCALGVFAQVKAPTIYKGRGNTEPVQEMYINDEHNFSLVTPPNSKPDEGFVTRSGFISAYACTDCSDASYFALSKVLPLDLPLADVVKGFQTKAIQESAANKLLKGFGQDNNATILSTTYAAYNGRPAIRFDFNFTKNDVNYNGVAVEIFIKEKKIMAVFAFLSSNPEPEPWFKVCEDALRSIIALKSSPIKSPREGIATRIGSSNNDAQNSSSSVYKGSGNTENIPPPPPPAIPKMISGGVLNGKAFSLPKPAYPAAARAVRASGAVNVQVTIDEEGNVIEAIAVSGHVLLRAAAVAAARQAIFAPTKLSGQPVKVTGVLVYNFIAPTPVENNP